MKAWILSSRGLKEENAVKAKGSASRVDMDEAYKEYLKSKKAYGGTYEEGGVYELDDYTVQALRQLGYDIEDLD